MVSHTELEKQSLSRPEIRHILGQAPRGWVYWTTEPTVLDRRRESRHDIDLLVDCAADGTFLFAHAANVSSLGIFVRTRRPLPVGTTMRLTIPITGARAERWDDEGELSLVGKVVWTSTKDPDHTGMGVELVEATRAQRTRLMALVETHAFIGGARPSA